MKLFVASFVSVILMDGDEQMNDDDETAETVKNFLGQENETFVWPLIIIALLSERVMMS